eukprot:638777-Hanusia_phi.AAC.1
MEEQNLAGKGEKAPAAPTLLSLKQTLTCLLLLELGHPRDRSEEERRRQQQRIVAYLAQNVFSPSEEERRRREGLSCSCGVQGCGGGEAWWLFPRDRWRRMEVEPFVRRRKWYVPPAKTREGEEEERRRRRELMGRVKAGIIAKHLVLFEEEDLQETSRDELEVWEDRRREAEGGFRRRGLPASEDERMHLRRALEEEAEERRRGPAGATVLSAYERERLERIRRNKEALENVGLGEGAEEDEEGVEEGREGMEQVQEDGKEDGEGKEEQAEELDGACLKVNAGAAALRQVAERLEEEKRKLVEEMGEGVKEEEEEEEEEEAFNYASLDPLFHNHRKLRQEAPEIDE